MNFSLTIEEAVHRLTVARTSFDPGTVEEFLQQRSNTYRLFHLYQTFFPEQWEASRASIYLRPHPNGHTFREIELFDLLDDEWFPVSWMVREEMQTQQINGIPIIDMGHSWQDESACDQHPAWQVLYPLCPEGHSWFHSDECDIIDWYREFLNVTITDFVKPKATEFKQIEEYFSGLEAPYCYLPNTLKMLDKTTDNIWLDCPNEAFDGYGGDIMPFTEESFLEMREEWEIAKFILQEAHMLVNWIGEDVDQNFNQLLDIWNYGILHHCTGITFRSAA